jgi:aspartate racemase
MIGRLKLSGKVVGIIGGMGPEATLDFMSKIIKGTPARVDQDHIRILVDNNPQIPCRVKAIMEHKKSPGPIMADMARRLEKWGAELIVIPCNTAHFYIQEIIEAVHVPVLNMVEETVRVLMKDSIKNVALLATNATLKTKLYEKKLVEAGIQFILPSQSYQEMMMRIIFEIKSGNVNTSMELLDRVIHHVLDKGADSIILGCTELPMIVKNDRFEVSLYDPTHILAQSVVKYATAKNR